MGNQGKILGKQSSKMYVFLHISVLSFIFEKKLLLKLGETPFSVFTSVSELGISLLIGAEMLFCGFSG